MWLGLGNPGLQTNPRSDHNQHIWGPHFINQDFVILIDCLDLLSGQNEDPASCQLYLAELNAGGNYKTRYDRIKISDVLVSAFYHFSNKISEALPWWGLLAVRPELEFPAFN